MKIRIEPVQPYTNKGQQQKFFIQLISNSDDIYDSHDTYLSRTELLNLKSAIEEVLQNNSIVYNQL